MKNNKLDVEGAIAVVTKYDPSKVDLAREIANMCSDITGEILKNHSPFHL